MPDPARPDPGAPEALRARLDDALDHYRRLLRGCLDGLEEEEARRRLVPSRTTLLGLVKHVTYVEKFYFEHCVTGRALAEIGVASTPDRSFVLRRTDTIASILEAHEVACEESREAAASLDLDEVVTGRGEQQVVDLYQKLLLDLVHHCGHADILREQVLAAR